MDKDYTCTLSEACLKQAKDELNEDPKNRLSSVNAFREWIEQQPHLVCRTDTDFLIRFLRTAKFSQLRAREMLEGYLTLKIEQSRWYHNWSPKDPDVAPFFEAGVFVPLPGYYKNGMKILVHRYSALGKTIPKTVTSKYKDALSRYWFMLMWYFLKDENTQVSGLLYIMDFTDCPLKALTVLNMNDSKEIMRYQGNFPGRFKGFWLYNESTFADAILTLFRPFMKKKLLDRLRTYGSNLEKLYKDVPQSMLPEEYLPDDYEGPKAGSFDTLAEKFYKEISEEKQLEALMYESNPKWGIDKSKKPSDIPSESFRKLNID